MEAGGNARGTHGAGKGLRARSECAKAEGRNEQCYSQNSFAVWGGMAILSTGLTPFFARTTNLFSDTKLAKNGVEQVFSGGFADHFADGVGGDAQIRGH